MKCHECSSGELVVIHTEITTSNAIKRRRQCSSCEERVTTYERAGELNEHEQRLVEDFRTLPPTGRKTLWEVIRTFKSIKQ